MKVMLRSAVVLVSLIALVPSPALAQFTSHLKCHKVKDSLQLKATADLLTTLQPQYAASGCRITKGTQFCVPVDKQNVQPPPPRPDITGQGLSYDFICYKLKCPGGLGDQVVTDQFGSRTLSHLRTDMLCVPAVKGTVPPVVTTTTTSSTTSTSIPPGTCCGAQQIVLTTSPGTARFGPFPSSFPFPGGGTITIEAGPADPFPTCRHDAIVPAAGLSLPAFCDNGLFYTHKIITTGCTSGGTDGSGRVWDGVAACADADVSKTADSRDGVCDPDLTACAGPPSGNNLGDVDATRGGPCDPAGLNTRIDIPATMLVWTDGDASADCPDEDGQFDPGVDVLAEQDSLVLTLTTGTASTVFADKSGPACFIEAGGGPVGPVSATGAPAGGPCCQVGQTATLAVASPIFGGGFPLADYPMRLSIPATVSSCNAWPGPATCTLPGGCLD